MAKTTLPTNYVDDILNASTSGKRKYRTIYNEDGTVSFIDVTPYDQEGSNYGAGDINATNSAVNESFDKNKLIKELDTINALTEEGYAPDALAVKQLNESLGQLAKKEFTYIGVGSGTGGTVLDIGEYTEILFCALDTQYNNVYNPTFISVDVLKTFGQVCTNIQYNKSYFQVWVTLSSNNIFKAHSFAGDTGGNFNTVVYAR